MSSTYKIKAFHHADRLRLKEVKEKLSQPALEFSNYELVIKYAEDSYLFLYNYGSVVFFNVSEDIQEKELANIQAFRAPSEVVRSTDQFTFEVDEKLEGLSRVFFDKVQAPKISYARVRITCMLLAESTALESYEILVENLLEKTSTFTRKLEREGKILQSSEALIQFIGMCLNTKQEIISNLYIVDSPDETWENVELDKLHQELKTMFEVDTRYRALDYKIRIIQDSLELIVDLSKSKRETFLELTIILLIAFEIVLSFVRGH